MIQRPPPPPLLAAAFAVVLASGCAVHTVKNDPKLPVSLGDSYAGGRGAKVATGRWWRDFGDKQLDSLVERAVRSNFDVRRAWARLAMTQAGVRIADSGAMPQLNAQVEAGYSVRQFFIGGRVNKIESYSVPLSVTASYELDLWGRVSASRRAALTDLQASRQDVSTVAMSVSAAVVDTWLALREARAQVALLAAQVQLGERLLAVVEGRFAQGLTDAVAVLQQRQLVAGVRGQLPQLEDAIGGLQNQLRVLTGVGPGAPLKEAAAATLPALPSLPDTGVPANLLDQRPDVLAARLRVVAADHRIGMALADRYPSVRLSASAGLSLLNPQGDVLTNPVWALAASLLGPLFDGGRRAAEVERTRAALHDSVLAWAQTVVRAAVEVQDALRREQQQQKTIAALDGQLELAQKTLDESRRRFTAGVGDFLPVLTAIQGLQGLQRQHLSASRALLAHRVSLHRALGGTWTAELKPGVADHDEQQADHDEQRSQVMMSGGEKS